MDLKLLAAESYPRKTHRASAKSCIRGRNLSAPGWMGNFLPA